MIALACDHTGIELKKEMMKLLDSMGLEWKDFGTDTAVSCDYPVYGYRAAKAVASGECDRGILVCTTGIGMSIVANKVRGVRCALLHDLMSARLTREHNDANMMALGQGATGTKLALEIVDMFLDTPFSEGERHCRRISKIEEA